MPVTVNLMPLSFPPGGFMYPRWLIIWQESVDNTIKQNILSAASSTHEEDLFYLYALPYQVRLFEIACRESKYLYSLPPSNRFISSFASYFLFLPSFISLCWTVERYRTEFCSVSPFFLYRPKPLISSRKIKNNGGSNTEPCWTILPFYNITLINIVVIFTYKCFHTI